MGVGEALYFIQCSGSVDFPEAVGERYFLKYWMTALTISKVNIDHKNFSISTAKLCNNPGEGNFDYYPSNVIVIVGSSPPPSPPPPLTVA